jgi:hypothetical protein
MPGGREVEPVSDPLTLAGLGCAGALGWHIEDAQYFVALQTTVMSQKSGRLAVDFSRWLRRVFDNLKLWDESGKMGLGPTGDGGATTGQFPMAVGSGFSRWLRGALGHLKLWDKSGKMGCGPGGDERARTCQFHVPVVWI